MSSEQAGVRAGRHREGSGKRLRTTAAVAGVSACAVVVMGMPLATASATESPVAEAQSAPAPEPKAVGNKRADLKRGGLPEVGKIKVTFHGKGKKRTATAKVPVKYTKALKRTAPKRAKESAKVMLRVWNKRAAHGTVSGVLQRSVKTERKITSRTEVYQFQLRHKAAQRLVKGKDRKHLLEVDVSHRIKHAVHAAQHSAVPANHTKNGGATWYTSGKKYQPNVTPRGSFMGQNGIGAMSVRTSMLIQNVTPEPININTQPVLCMDTQNTDFGAFNAQQGATLAPGETNEGVLATTSSASTMARYQGPDHDTFSTTLAQQLKYDSIENQALQMAAAKLIDVPYLSQFIAAWDGCGSNASLFQIIATNSDGQYSHQAFVVDPQFNWNPPTQVESMVWDLTSAAWYEMYNYNDPKWWGGWDTNGTWWNKATRQTFAAFLDAPHKPTSESEFADVSYGPGNYFNALAYADQFSTSLGLTPGTSPQFPTGKQDWIGDSGMSIQAQVLGSNTVPKFPDPWTPGVLLLQVLPGGSSNSLPANCCQQSGSAGPGTTQFQ